MVFYNTHPYFGALIMGAMVAMEEAKANDDEGVSEEAINGFKVALMGPFAGIGDSFFWGTVHPIILAVSANLALQGNFLGFVFAFLIAAEAILGTYYPFMWGYNSGTEIVEKIRTSHLIEKFTEGAKIVAMVVAGVMVSTLIHLSTPVVLFATEAEGSGINLQGILDSILPNLLPLGLLFFVYWLLKKKLNPLWVMVILLVLTVGFKALGWVG
jgi:mannose/fructose/N-acetylgalactosamine-specific phosphotransferase system component IID